LLIPIQAAKSLALRYHFFQSCPMQAHEFIFSKPKLRLGRKIIGSIAAAAVMSALTFFVSLFFAIAFLFISGIVHNARPDMTLAYRAVAAPIALAVLPAAGIAAFVWQIVRYRRQRMHFDDGWMPRV
jgi:hypothetical protein